MFRIIGLLVVLTFTASLGMTNYVFAGAGATPFDCSVNIKSGDKTYCLKDENYKKKFLDSIADPEKYLTTRGIACGRVGLELANDCCKKGCCLYEAGDSCLDCC